MFRASKHDSMFQKTQFYIFKREEEGQAFILLKNWSNKMFLEFWDEANASVQSFFCKIIIIFFFSQSFFFYILSLVTYISYRWKQHSNSESIHYIQLFYYIKRLTLIVNCYLPLFFKKIGKTKNKTIFFQFFSIESSTSININFYKSVMHILTKTWEVWRELRGKDWYFWISFSFLLCVWPQSVSWDFEVALTQPPYCV